VVRQKTYVRSCRGLLGLTLERWEMKRIISLISFILLLCAYHCERIHSSRSRNLRQAWQRIARFEIGEMEI